MSRTISQRELQSASDEMMSALAHGESFIVTRNGIPVAELTPVLSRRYVNREAVLRTLLDTRSIDPIRFRKDVDRGIGQDPTPRG